MKFEIMMRILIDLMSKKVVSAKYLAEKYGVSTRSIYRYVETIESANVPIYTTRGAQGGFSIVDTFRINSSFLTRKEFEQTISALSSICNEVPNKTLTGVIDKLKSTFKKEDSNLNLSSGNLVIDSSPWGDSKQYKGKLATIENCVETQTMLEISYHDRNVIKTTRKIEPHIIVFKQGLWYVYAYCHLRNSFRFFKIGRIEKAIILEEKFERKIVKKEDLPLSFWNSNESVMENVVLQLTSSTLSEVEDWLGIESIEKIKGVYYASAMLPIDNGLVSKIMSYGKNVKVIKPNSLKEKVKTFANEIASVY